jgi:hypothetical protein
MPVRYFDYLRGQTKSQQGVFINDAKLITFLNTAKGNTTGTTLTYSLTVTSAPNQILVVTVSAYRAGSNAVSGVTYGGVALTQAIQNSYTVSYPHINAIFYLVNPTPGTANVVVTVGNGAVASVASCFSGVNQSTPINQTTYVNTASTATPNLNLTVSPNEMVVDSLYNYGSSTSSVGGSQTLIGSDAYSPIRNSSSYLRNTNGNSLNMAWTLSAASVTNHTAIALQPA